MKSHKIMNRDGNRRTLQLIWCIMMHKSGDKQGMSLEGLSVANLDFSLRDTGFSTHKYDVFIGDFSKITTAGG